MTEYLPSLRARTKWNEVFSDIKKGDVLMVLQPDLPRGRRLLGRIIEIFPGRDGHTRVVKVQCGNKTYVRPIHTLVPLETTGH